jgi:hypothetical protein
LATSFKSQARQGSGNVVSGDGEKREVLEVVHQWETARQTGAFPESVKSELRDVDREFRLIAVGPGEWELRAMKPAGTSVRLRAEPDRIKSWAEFNAGAVEGNSD